MSYSSVALFSDMPEGIQTTNSQSKICSLLIFHPTQMLIKGFLETGPSKLGTNLHTSIYAEENEKLCTYVHVCTKS